MAPRQTRNESHLSVNRRRNRRHRMPTLRNTVVTLRALRAADAVSLLEHLANPSVAEFIAPPMRTVDEFTRFIRWSQAKRRSGTHLCFGIVPSGQSKPVGLVQIWPVESDFSTAEWGFALGHAFWGTGLFVEAAHLMLAFAFDTLGVLRLEARAVDANGRGNGILRKLGATAEGTLRGGFRSGQRARDHVMWSILAAEWTTRRNNYSIASRAGS
jgi:ribosomal-protein-alanine N-acetyltransferase